MLQINNMVHKYWPARITIVNKTALSQRMIIFARYEYQKPQTDCAAHVENCCLMEFYYKCSFAFQVWMLGYIILEGLQNSIIVALVILQIFAIN